MDPEKTMVAWALSTVAHPTAVRRILALLRSPITLSLDPMCATRIGFPQPHTVYVDLDCGSIMAFECAELL